MNSLDAALHVFAATSWRIGLLIVLCLGLRRLLRGRLPAAAVFAMWLVLAGALLVPVGFPAVWSPFSLVPRFGFGQAAAMATPLRLVQGSESGVMPIADLTLPTPALALEPLTSVELPEPGLLDRLQTIPASRWATLVWLSGVALLVLRRATALMLFSRRLGRDLAPADARLGEAVERCRARLGLRGEVTAGVTGLVETPALHGIFRPRLLMPRGMGERLTDAELELVVLHELGHVRRRDLLAHTLIHAAAVLHWFNPLAWLAAWAARADCEHACDEFVLSRMDEVRREAYGEVLLKVVGLAARPSRVPVLLGIFESKVELRRRIVLIAGYSGRGTAGLLAGALFVGSVAAMALTREAVAQAPVVAAVTAVAAAATETVDAEQAARAAVARWQFTPGLPRKGATPEEQRELDLLNYAQGLQRLAQREQAAAVLVSALRANELRGPNAVRGWSMAAMNYRNLNRPDRALSVLKEGLEMFPESEELRNQMTTVTNLVPTATAAKSVPTSSASASSANVVAAAGDQGRALSAAAVGAEATDLAELTYQLALSRRRIADLRRSAGAGATATPALEAEQAKERELTQQVERIRASQPASAIVTASESVAIKVSVDGSVAWLGERVGLDEMIQRLQRYAQLTTPPQATAPQGRVELQADAETGFSQLFGYVANEARKMRFQQVAVQTPTGELLPLVLAGGPELAAGQGASPNPVSAVVIQISTLNRSFWNREPVTFDQIAERLQRGGADGSVTAVRIAGDRFGTVGDTVRLLALLRQVGIENVSVETRTSDTGNAGVAPAVTNTPAVPIGTIRLIATRPLNVQVKSRNPDGTEGDMLLRNTPLRAGDFRDVPWTTALLITASEGANLQIEVDGKRMGVGFTGYNMGWMPAPQAAGARVGVVSAVPDIAPAVMTAVNAPAAPVANAAPRPGVREHSAAVIAGLQQLKTLTDRNDTAAALALLDELLRAGAPGDSFDQAQLNLYKGNLSLGLPDARPAIAPLEKAIEINSRVDLLPRQDIAQAHKNLSIVYYVAMQAAGTTDADKARLVGRSVEHLEAYFAMFGEPSPDEANQYASFLFTQATLGRNDNPDLALIRKARAVAERAVARDSRFRTDLQSLILTAHQVERNNVAVAETLELLLSKSPAGAQSTRYHQLLPRTYLQLANEAADRNEPTQAREYRVRAIAAYERAQTEAGLYTGANGQDPTIDILNLSKSYYDIGQAEKGADVLLDGVRNGKIRGEMGGRAWGFAATYLQQAGKQDRALSVLLEAAEKSPQNGQYDAQIAQNHYMERRYDEAIIAIREALRKGVPGKETTMRLSEAYYLY